MLKDIDCLQVSVMFSEDMPLKSADGERILGGLQSPPVFKDIHSSCEFVCITVLPIVLPPIHRSLQVEVANVQADGAIQP
jgi:hypothetical protein